MSSLVKGALGTAVKAASSGVIAIGSRLTSVFNATKAAGKSFADDIVSKGRSLQNAAVTSMNKTRGGALVVQGVSAGYKVVKTVAPPAIVAYQAYDTVNTFVNYVEKKKSEREESTATGNEYMKESKILKIEDTKAREQANTYFKQNALDSELNAIFTYASALFKEEIPNNQELSARYIKRLKEILVQYPDLRNKIPSEILEFLFSQ